MRHKSCDIGEEQGRSIQRRARKRVDENLIEHRHVRTMLDGPLVGYIYRSMRMYGKVLTLGPRRRVFLAASFHFHDFHLLCLFYLSGPSGDFSALDLLVRR